MKIGFVVDGEAEFRSFAKLYSRLSTKHTLLNPLRTDIQPLSSAKQIAAVVDSPINILRGKQASLIVILIDREDRSECPGQWATKIEAEVKTRYSFMQNCRFAVVVKNTCYENWLISDTNVFINMPKRFNLSQKRISQVVPGKADKVDAQSVLKEAAIQKSYDKIADAVHIMTHANPLIMAANSRSFRRLLRIIESPPYLQQSRHPAPPTDQLKQPSNPTNKKRSLY